MFLKTTDADIMIQCFGGGGRTFVAHGGWVGSGELWIPPFAHLSRDWRVVTYDHRGTGATVSRAPRISFDMLVDDLFRVLDHCGIDRCVIAGESAGAAVVLEAALRKPDRFDALVLVSGRYVGNRTPQRDQLIQGCRADFPATMKAFVAACVPEADCDAERAWGEQIVLRSSPQAAVELLECMEGIEIESRVDQLAHKCLLLHGTRDNITPLASSERLQSLMRNARLVIAEGAGHVPTITRPQWIANQINTFAASV